MGRLIPLMAALCLLPLTGCQQPKTLTSISVPSADRPAPEHATQSEQAIKGLIAADNPSRVKKVLALTEKSTPAIYGEGKQWPHCEGFSQLVEQLLVSKTFYGISQAAIFNQRSVAMGCQGWNNAEKVIQPALEDALSTHKETAKPEQVKQWTQYLAWTATHDRTSCAPSAMRAAREAGLSFEKALAGVPRDCAPRPTGK